MPDEDDDDMAARRRRALFRAVYRGTREMDFLIGRFAEAQVQEMTKDELSQFEMVMMLPEPVLMAAIIDGDGSGAFDVPTAKFIARIRAFHHDRD